ncbi:MAG: PIG-L family deacetylase, partial [Bacteroidota bacterium]
DLYNEVQKLGVVGSVLYVAAHPDDENTTMISYFANERKVRTAYLSLTRGDGGQNRIGTDIREKLGVIRTQELLQARRLDGGEQFFSRANDFGFSKHPDETLAFWNKQEVLHDVVKVIREFRPDIIVNRFDHRTPGRTHGHHTSSAMLSVESYDMSGNPNSFKDRLGHLEPWQPERIFFNTSWWFYGSRENFEKAPKTNLAAVDAGVYYPNLGMSNTEISALSRSMHKSQGFGRSGTRGSSTEYVELIRGSSPSDNEDPLSDIDLTWNRLEGGAPIQEMINQLLADYDHENPSQNVAALVQIYRAIEKIEDTHWRKIKLKDLQDIIIHSAGLYLGATTDQPYTTPGGQVEVNYELVNRSAVDVQVASISIGGGGAPIQLGISLPQNERKELETSFITSTDARISNPFWLDLPGTYGMYEVADPNDIGKPENDPAYTATFELTIGGLPLSVERDVIYKTTDPVKGEIRQPFYIVPPASVGFTDPVYLFPNRESKEIKVSVKAFRDNLSGVVTLDHPTSWIVSPQLQEVSFENRGQEQQLTFKVKGPFLSEGTQFKAQLMTSEGIAITDEVDFIEHDHIPTQMILTPASAKFERLSIERKGENIAYLQGAGDDIPTSLRQIGYRVSELETSDLTTERLSGYDALIIGVRAYNTNKDLRLKKAELEAYMSSGGTVLVQYNTNRGVRGEDIAPYPMTLSRDRVTDETAPISFLDAQHEVLNYPNKISTRDFKDWVQERGLYFPNEWDERYEAPIACSDKLEPLRKGGLLIAPVGQGYFIYTGYSWFRQLPAGVPGAFRLFANLISIGKNGIVSEPSENAANE